MDNDVSGRLLNGDRAIWETTCRECQKKFFSWALKFDEITKEDAEDAFQEALLKLYSMAIAGTLPPITKSINHYLFGIAKNQIFKILEKKDGMNCFSLDFLCNDDEEYYYNLMQEMGNPRLDILMKCFYQLSENEKKFIDLSIFKKLPLATVAIEMELKNEKVAKQIKHRIKEKLKKMVEEELRKLGY
jgi:RNA polymerase sigma factor (sigma-70 family)